MKILLLLALFAVPIHAQSLSRTALYASAGLDLESTWLNMRPGIREGNPLLGQSRVRQASIVLGLTAFTDWAGRKRPAVRWIAIGVHVAAVVWNSRQRM